LTVTGILIEELGNNPNSIGNIGSISADGKLTLNLPSVEDGKLFQIGGDDDIPEELKGFRYGMLVTTPALSLVNSNGDESLQLFYANKTPPLQELLAPFFRNMPKGWSYLGNRGIVTDLSSYKWVIKTGGQ
jgi:hypothetical protein